MDVVLPKSGKYVVAVSGGVDSGALLNMLSNQTDLDLTVAHFDHGIREDSREDRLFSQRLAKQYGLPFEYKEGKLGPGVSEAKAREARYKFLKKVQKETNAQAIITAHHQDDLIETAILNMLRGTGRKGLTALKSRADVVRPLLNVSKAELIAYAQKHDLQWREDPTNQDTAYLRNYIRHNLLPRFKAEDRARLVELVASLKITNQELDAVLGEQLQIHTSGDRLDRGWFKQLPHEVAREVMAEWLRAHDIRGFDSKALERLVVAAKVGQIGKSFPVIQGHHLQIDGAYLALRLAER